MANIELTILFTTVTFHLLTRRAYLRYYISYMKPKRTYRPRDDMRRSWLRLAVKIRADEFKVGEHTNARALSPGSMTLSVELYGVALTKEYLRLFHFRPSSIIMSN